MTAPVMRPAADTCSCHTDPARVMAMVAEYDRARRAAAGVAWTTPLPLTHPLLWTCSAEQLHPAVLAAVAGDTARTEFGRAVVRAVADDLQRVEATSSEAGLLDGLDETNGTTLLVNGTVFTADPDRPWAEAVAFAGEKILAVGGGDELRTAHPGSRIVDLGGRVVIPGINDAHMHHTPDPTGVRLRTDELLDPTLKQLSAAVAAAVADTPAGTWLLGTMGPDLICDRSLDRGLLDAIAPAHPVLLLGMTNHTNVLNSAALAALDIGEDEPEVLGGSHERDPVTGALTGRINEYAQWRPQRTLAALATVEQGAESIRALSRDCLRYGITTVQNMSWTSAPRYLEMVRAAQVPLRVRVIDFPATRPAGRDDVAPTLERAAVATRSGPRVSWSGRKWILDGTPVEAAANMGFPYRDRPGAGTENFPAAEIDGMLTEGADADDQVLLHAIGTRAVRMVVEALDRYPDQEWRDRHLRVEHADCATGHDLERLRDHGAMVVQNPTHFLFADLYRTRFGDPNPYSLFRSMFDIGLPVGIGSDGPLNPFLGMFAAVTHPARPEEGVDVATVLTAYTAGSARAEGREADRGRLAPGYLADLAVLSQDVFVVAPEALPATESVLTVIGGRIEHDPLFLAQTAAPNARRPSDGDTREPDRDFTHGTC